MLSTVRRLAAMIGAVTVLAVAVAACDDKAGPGHAQFNGAAAPSASAGTGGSDAPGDDDPADAGTATPVVTATNAGQPSATATATTAPPPAGNAYTARLPKFGPPPAPVKIGLPEGAGAPYFSRIPTEQPVAFLTIDDGWVKRPEALELLRESGVKVTLFLTINAIKDNPGYFKQLRDAGADIEAHTLTHPSLKGKSYDFQKHEICGSADQLKTMYGERPKLFRPPFGDKDATTLKVAHDCGLQAGFFWKETVDKGIVRYQEGKTVQKGDIILMHFRDRFVDDFIAALQAISAAGLTPALLVDYLPAG
ncbi:polysaccharide deacetylase family protein [Dactylosporangium vinaceum]|uniref:Polysaccharide deacetylase family protein n=1 Tax=Dactylosporangium vinaceum TaxID=53362 RepID=A0ABV5MLR5_9ACTN|nr:polysaccharide deacetylase family protein [Dactylosporangium vinaceum]